MRRKSGRSGRSSPEKTGSDTTGRSRRQTSRKHKRSSSRSSVDSNDEKSKIKEPVQDVVDINPSEDDKTNNIPKNSGEKAHSPPKETKVKSSGDETSERKSSNRGTPLIASVSEDSQDSQEKGIEEKEEKKTKGKSKGKNKSNFEQSSNIIEPEIEHENVQGTPQSPSNDNADNENVQNVIEPANKHEEIKHLEAESEAATNQLMEQDVNFESEYTQENEYTENREKYEGNTKCQEKENKHKELKEDSSEKSCGDSSFSSRRKSSSEKEECSSSKRSSSKKFNKEERSLTPEIKDSDEKSARDGPNSRKKSFDQSTYEKSDGVENYSTKKKITLRRSPPINKETDKAEEISLGKERRSTTEESGKEVEEQEEKPRKKITLKRNNIDEKISSEEKSGPKLSDEYTRQPSTSEEFGEKKRRLSSLCEDKGQDGEDKPKRILKKIKLIRSLSRGKDDSHEEKTKVLSTQRRHMWNRLDWLDNLTFYNIDVDSIKIVCPSLAFLSEEEVHLESTPRERKKSESDFKRKISMDKSDDSDRPDYEKQTSEESSGEQKIELNPNIIAMNRKISIVDDTASKLKPPPSPSKNPTSDVLYITNLVRPFTVKQLKELLERTGKIKEDGFWTDRIKSKCYVHYESVEEAEATRNALHGVHWPIGNGKQLIIDYATVEDLEKAKNPAPAPKPIVDKVPEKENMEPVKVDDKYKEREREERKRRDGPVREWDLGKEESRRGHSRSKSRERARKHSRRSYTPEITDYIHRKQRKAEEPVPQKLMDDLFLKTKATPSIYWQPLSPEEIAMKQKQRLVRMEEHKRRIEETRVRLRDNRRGSFRRR